MKKKRSIKHAESEMMRYGYNPFWSEGALKPPIFQTSTFEFSSAEEGKAFFAKAYGKVEEIEQPMGLIYSRINNPNLEIFESRLCLWDHAEACAVFNSGMAAISTCLMTFTKPGDTILCSLPVYGGTNYFIENILAQYGISVLYFFPNEDVETVWQRIQAEQKEHNISVIYCETPANPTNQLIDLEMCGQLKNRLNNALLLVDNTFMGPIWQKPLDLGADLVLYSATKYIGGHSDVIAGAITGSAQHIKALKDMRTFLGNMASPYTAWLLTRSLETLQVRMEKQAGNAQKVAAFLKGHHLVNKLYYLGYITPRDQAIFNRQCTGAGAMISFEIKGGEKEAFRFLNALTLIKLAVSLGGTESLAEHPKTMTHTDMDEALKKLCGVSDGLIRLSIGIEHVDDIIDDLNYAFTTVENTEFSGLS